MTKILRYLILIIFSQFTASLCFAQFPYVESFRAATAPGITFGGAPSAFLTAAGSSSEGGTPIDPVGNGYLRLTNNTKNQKGYVYSNANFPSNNGLRVEFEYYIYGGTGADGISFFLFDATADPFVIGGFGGSLGYAQITTTNPISPGVSKGYLAIGLDEFGNFSNPTEGRQGGTGQFPGSVTLRGKGNGASLDPNNYKFLTTALVSNFGLSLVGDGNSRQPNPTSNGYRRVLMEMEPNPISGYNITVKITKGGVTPVTETIINNYHYSEPAPANLRYGFASSTGDQTNFHEVRNVAIEVFNSNSLTPPVAANDVLSICKGNTASIDVALNDFTNNAGAVLVNSTIDFNPSLGGQQSTYTIPGRGTFSIGSNGNVVFTPSTVFTGSVSTNYTIKDGYGQTSNSASLTINYSEPTIYPSAGPDKVVNVIAIPSSTMLDGSEHVGYSGTWTQVSGPSTAVFANSSSKNTTVSNLTNGTYRFRWTISSSGGCESSDDVEIIVNQRPVAVNDNTSTNLNTDILIPILTNDSDPNGNNTIDNSSIEIKSQPQHGTLVLDLVLGNVIYRPNAGYSGSDSFTYTIRDNYGAESNVGIVNIGVSIKPIGSNDNAVTFTDTQIVISVKDNDPDKATTNVVQNTNPANGSITVNSDGTIVYVPASGFSGRDAFTYKLKNASNVESDPITVNVSVRPKGTNDQSTTFTNAQVTIPVKTNDLSKNGTTVIANVSLSTGSVAVNTSGEILYTPQNGFSGKDVFTYILRTADGLDSDPISVNVNVRPMGTTDNVTTPINTAVSISVKDNDLSSAGTVVFTTSIPAHGTVSVNTSNVVTFTPTTGYSGTDTFTYILRTADGLDSDPILVNITINSPKPIGSADVANTTTNNPVTISVKDNDASQSGTTVVLPTGTTPNGTVVLNTSGVPVYTPDTGFSGKDSFTYILRNASNVDSDPITVTVNVKPVGANDTQNYILNTPVAINVKDNDLSKNNTSVVLTSSPANGTVSVTSNVVTYTPNTGFNGINTFTYVLRTADGLDSDPITVTVNPGTPVPTGSPDVASTTTNVPITIPVKDNDASQAGTTVVLSSGTTPSGTVVLNASGVPVYTPNTGFSGKDSFTYKLNNGGLESAPITVTVNVKPTGSPDSQSFNLNTPVAISVKDNDLSKTGTTVVVTSTPTNGTTSTSGTGIITFTPNTGFTGTNTFNYILRTADGLDSDPITVTVSATLPKPVGSSDLANTFTDVPVTISVKDNDASQSGTTVILQGNPTNGTVTLNPTGVPVYTPNSGFSGRDSFTYVLNNGTLNSDPITVTVNVKPIGSPDNDSYTINTPLPINVKTNDLSKTNTSVIINSSPANGTVAVNSSGIVTYTPATGFNGTNTFTYILRTADGLDSDPILVTLTPATVKPAGSPDVATTPTNTPVTIPVKDNDASKNGTTVEIKTTPTNGAVTLNSGGVPVYTPTTGYSGKDSFTYVLKNPEGLESDPITVTVNVKPVGSTDNATTQINTAATIDIKNNDLSKTGTTPEINTNPEHGTVTINANGSAKYTPATGFTGTDSFTYKLRTADGVESDPIVVIVTVTPAVQQPKVGLAKSSTSIIRNTDGSYRISYVFTLVNYANVGINQLSLIDDLSLAFPARTISVTRLSGSANLNVNAAFNGTTVKEMLLPTSSLAANAQGTIELEVTLAANQQGGTFLNSATVQGKSVADGTTTSDISTSGLVPDPVTPGNVSPSTPTQVVLLIAPNINVPVVTGNPITINIPLPPGTTVVITNPPTNGTITFDPVTGLPIYTPNPGYSGPDEFTYIIRDNNGNESQPGRATVTVTAPAKIGIAKALVSNTKNTDGSFNLTYLFTLVNYGDTNIERVSLTDNLMLAFPDATYQIININTSGNLQVNTTYNGNTVLNMLLPASTLEAKSKQQVEMQIKVTLNKDRGIFNNFAVAEGYSSGNGALTSDQSTNGFNPDPIIAGDVRPSELTPVELIKGSLKIPAGFSPNNDGINDYFIIENTQGQKLSLEIFNRWGNRIYRSSDYKNDWAGKSTEGIRVGDDVPVGTYYYVIIFDGKDKRVGYITINR